MEKQMARLAKARADAEFKKKYTERSEISATDGMKKARKDFKKDKRSYLPEYKPCLKKKDKKKDSPQPNRVSRGTPINLTPNTKAERK